MKVILIGSSNQVLNNHRKNQIDSFEDVVRFNRAPTIGYENFVGAKTTVRFCNPHVALNNFFEGQDMEFIPTIKNEKIISPHPFTPFEFYKIYHESCEYEYVDRKKQFNDFLEKYSNNLEDFFLDYQGHEPSLGLTGICYYLNKNIKPTIYGFDVYSENYTSSPHYWWNKTKIGGYHNFEYERKILKKLIQENIIYNLK